MVLGAAVDPVGSAAVDVVTAAEVGEVVDTVADVVGDVVEGAVDGVVAAGAGAGAAVDEVATSDESPQAASSPAVSSRIHRRGRRERTTRL